MCKMKLEHKITRKKTHEGQVQTEAELFVENLRLVSENHFKKTGVQRLERQCTTMLKY